MGRGDRDRPGANNSGTAKAMLVCRTFQDFTIHKTWEDIIGSEEAAAFSSFVQNLLGQDTTDHLWATALRTLGSPLQKICTAVVCLQDCPDATLRDYVGDQRAKKEDAERNLLLIKDFLKVMSESSIDGSP